MLFKMVTNQTECFILEQRSVMKSLLVENCKQCQIYTRKCDMYIELCFSKKKKIFKNVLNMALTLQAYIKNIVYRVGSH